MNILFSLSLIHTAFSWTNKISAQHEYKQSTTSLFSERREGLFKKVWDNRSAVKVQGGTLKTWPFTSPDMEAVHVVIKTEGRPMDADIDLWQGPDNNPHKIRVYVEDGRKRPFSTLILTPKEPNTIALRNIGHMEFPFQACVSANTVDDLGPDMKDEPMIIQGGALRTYPFNPSVETVQVLLKTDGRPLNARIELLQGPNNIKQAVELYTEDGSDRPFFMVLETPGSGNVVRIVNTAPLEFPMTAWVEAYSTDNDFDENAPVLGGDTFMGN